DVRHYPGGLAEWMQSAPQPSAATQVTALGPSQEQAVAGRSQVSKSVSGASAQFVDALSNRSIGSLLRLWVAIVVGCGLVYWLFAWLQIRALEANGGPF